MNKVLYRYDPFCVKSSIEIVAEVVEAGRNATQTASLRIPLVSNSISVSFTDNSPVFRPGLDYIIKVLFCAYSSVSMHNLEVCWYVHCLWRAGVHIILDIIMYLNTLS